MSVTSVTGRHTSSQLVVCFNQMIQIHQFMTTDKHDKHLQTDRQTHSRSFTVARSTINSDYNK